MSESAVHEIKKYIKEIQRFRKKKRKENMKIGAQIFDSTAYIRDV